MTRRRRSARDRLRRDAVLPEFLANSEFGCWQFDDLLYAMRRTEAATDSTAGYAAAVGHAGWLLRSVGTAELRAYDANIAALGERLRMTPHHGRMWKPHQYLELLFVDRFLDRLFGDLDAFCRDLNHFRKKKPAWGRSPYHENDLRGFAVQSASGSGKALLMQANVLQYEHYRRRAGERLNNILLLVPNDRMARQHEREFRAGDLRARRFDPRGSNDTASSVKILALDDLNDRVSVSEFGHDNLVLVDEGHLGTSGEIWRRRRSEFANAGFLIEYSASFYQASKEDDTLRSAYTRSLLFDYGYREFHADGYGKDYTITRFPSGKRAGGGKKRIRRRRLLGCLLTFYRQCRLYRTYREGWRDFHPVDPLLVFAGSAPVDSNEVDHEVRSDVVHILEFFGWFLAGGPAVRAMIRQWIDGESGSAPPTGPRDDFAGRFSHFRGTAATTLYDDICDTVFHGRGRLRIVRVESGEGELHLSVADATPFGVVSVGYTDALYETLLRWNDPPFDLERSEQRHRHDDLLFPRMERPNSEVTIAVGSRHFLAGPWGPRVRSLVFMQAGEDDGLEILRTLGHGVRLFGWKRLPKRYRAGDSPPPVEPDALSESEKIYIYGLRKSSMKAVEFVLREEGIVCDWDRSFLPITWNFGRQTDLKWIRRRNAVEYGRSSERPVLPGPSEPGRPFVEWNPYPDFDSEASAADASTGSDGVTEAEADPQRNRGRLAPDQVAFFRRTRIYDAVLQRKLRFGWHNLLIEPRTVDALLDSDDWYDLQIQPGRMRAEGFARVRELEGIAIDLISEYADAFWRQRRRIWEYGRIEVGTLSAEYPNHIGRYELSVDAANTKSVDAVRRLSPDVRQNRVRHLYSLWGRHHAYDPLLSEREIHLLDYDRPCEVAVYPRPLTKPERRVAEALAETARSSPKWLRGRDLFYLRNLPRRHCVAAFDDFGYSPDFIVWLRNAADQHVVFLDAKGLDHFGRGRRKVRMHTEIRRLERQARVLDPAIHLHAYVLSPARPEQIGDGWRSRGEWESEGVYFVTRRPWLERVITHALDSREGATGSTA